MSYRYDDETENTLDQLEPDDAVHVLFFVIGNMGHDERFEKSLKDALAELKQDKKMRST